MVRFFSDGFRCIHHRVTQLHVEELVRVFEARFPFSGSVPHYHRCRFSYVTARTSHPFFVEAANQISQCQFVPLKSSNPVPGQLKLLRKNNIGRRPTSQLIMIVPVMMLWCRVMVKWCQSPSYILSPVMPHLSIPPGETGIVLRTLVRRGS